MDRTLTPDEAWAPAVVLVSATLLNGAVALLLHKPRELEGAMPGGNLERGLHRCGCGSLRGIAA